MPEQNQRSDFKWLNKLAPCFAVNGNNVKVIETPKEFYSTLLNCIQNVNKRIVLSALYLGTDELDKQLVNCLNERIKEKGTELDVDILLDYTRGSRGEINSRTLLAPILKENPSNSIKISFFHTPSLRGVVKSCLPARWNEVVGVNHIKLFIFDDTLVISGANLSTNYFEQRQDRYMSFTNAKSLADYFQALTKTVSSFSFQLQPNGELKLSEECPHHPVTGNFQEYAAYVRTRMQPYSLPYSYEDNKSQSILQDWNPFRILFNKFFPAVTPQICENMSNDNVSSISPAQFAIKSDCDDCDTFIYPSLQLGCVGITQDENLTKTLLKLLPENTQTYFTSGYFNITNEYSKLILDNKSQFDILVASPDANGFLGSAGVSGKIPSVYVQLTKNFFDQVAEKKRNDIKIWEYMRPKWTYHSKGLWFYDKGSDLPCLTMLGSSNYGSRSVHRDLEAQITLVTTNTGLMKQLHQERVNLFKHARPVTQSTFTKPKYAVTRWVSFATAILRHYF
ncbi:CDP-diacylglycerol--glycerol-3-phosphate 3-phosphatidyltransferase, mitochondrial [Ciona intestinalis]